MWWVKQRTGKTGLRLATELNPDLVLMDITMPGMSASSHAAVERDAAQHARAYPNTHEDESLLREAIRAGASGYILKQAVEAELISAIRAVGRGELYIHRP